jgi:hypothetical protein
MVMDGRADDHAAHGWRSSTAKRAFRHARGSIAAEGVAVRAVVVARIVALLLSGSTLFTVAEATVVL